MKKYIILIIFISILPIQILAQAEKPPPSETPIEIPSDGSTGGTSDPILTNTVSAPLQAVPARTATPQASALPTQTPRPLPSVSPSASPSVSPILTNNEAGEQEGPATNTTTFALLAVAGAGIFGYVSFLFLRSNTENKKGDGRCDSIKTLLDQKKKELEDFIRNWPEEKIKSMAKEKIISELKKDEDAKKIVETAESLKAKHDKLKETIEILQKKYDLCMLELPSVTSTKAVIFDLNGVLVKSIQPGSAEKEVPEMIELAKELKSKGVKLFLLSNSLAEMSEYYDENLPFIKELFDKVYYSWQTGFSKPDKRAYELILSENKLKPEECVYFDDMEENVMVAVRLGIRSFVFKDAENTRKILKL